MSDKMNPYLDGGFYVQPGDNGDRPQTDNVKDLQRENERLRRELSKARSIALGFSRGDIGRDEFEKEFGR